MFKTKKTTIQKKKFSQKKDTNVCFMVVKNILMKYESCKDEFICLIQR